MISFSKFILKNIEPILVEWETFAATLVPEAQRMDRAVLRDHGQQMLEAIGRDLSHPESAQQKSDKSKGNVAGKKNETAAKTHGADRLALGLTPNAAVAEYRVLRASVIGMWQDEIKDTPTAKPILEDLIRFIVKALAMPFQVHEHTVQVSASIGVSSSPQDAQTTDSLMRNADFAMDAAKSAGRDQVVFFSSDLLELPRGESTFGRL